MNDRFEIFTFIFLTETTFASVSLPSGFYWISAIIGSPLAWAPLNWTPCYGALEVSVLLLLLLLLLELGIFLWTMNVESGECAILTRDIPTTARCREGQS